MPRGSNAGVFRWSSIARGKTATEQSPSMSARSVVRNSTYGGPLPGDGVADIESGFARTKAPAARHIYAFSGFIDAIVFVDRFSSSRHAPPTYLPIFCSQELRVRVACDNCRRRRGSGVSRLAGLH